jgi:hypothetical protein
VKKIVVLSIVFPYFLITFLACSDKDYSNSVGSFTVQYIRTNGYISDIKYPIITGISSKKELEKYYNYYKDKYDLSTHSQVHSDSTIGFIDAIKDYSDDFFINNFLIIVLLEEGSGSIRHKVEEINQSGNIFITRLLPEVGTGDMAEWHIIIGLNNNLKKEQFKVTFIDKNVS